MKSLSIYGAALLCGGLLFNSLPAFAQSVAPTANRVAMAGLKGRRGRGIAKMLVRALRDAEIDARLMNDWRDGANNSRKAWPKVSAELELAAWVDGRLLRKKRRWKLDIVIHRGLDGVVLGKLRRSEKTIDELRAEVQEGVIDQLTEILNNNMLPDTLPPETSDSSNAPAAALSQAQAPLDEGKGKAFDDSDEPLQPNPFENSEAVATTSEIDETSEGLVVTIRSSDGPLLQTSESPATAAGPTTPLSANADAESTALTPSSESPPSAESRCRFGTGPE